MIVLAVIGLGLASYLTYVHYSGIKPACSLGGSCEKVQTSAYSHLAGVPDFHSNGVPTGRQKLAGARRGFRRAPLVSRQPVYKPGSGWHANNVRIRDGHSSGTPVTRRLQQPTRTAGSGH